ncbi:MAG: acetate/propionate family kinase, partial [Thermomicrobiales bacterium]
GSSSVKAAVYAVQPGAEDPARQCSVQVERIGAGQGQCTVALPDRAPDVQSGRFADYAGALEWLVAEVERRGLLSGIAAAGHRVVHGGTRHATPELVSDAMLADLREWFAVDPDHLPQAVAAIGFLADRFPDLRQVACFDTHFHETMPAVAKLLPLPRRFSDEGVRRFGFHGLSYESIMAQLARIGPAAARGRVVIAHLGSGASMVTVENGRSVDTSMGFTPTGGLMMGTRPGDLDPGLLLYLLQVRGLSPNEINRLLNKESGLLGVSGTSQDLRDLLAAEEADGGARSAVALFYHIAKKHLAGLAAILGGVDTLIFTGGAGERSAPVRSRICAGLDFIGISIDPERNDAHDAVISTTDGSVTVRVMRTDEEMTVARHTLRLVTS